MAPALLAARALRTPCACVTGTYTVIENMTNNCRNEPQEYINRLTAGRSILLLYVEFTAPLLDCQDPRGPGKKENGCFYTHEDVSSPA
jgi:hypothetical protein